MYLDLLYLTLIVVYIVDLSGFTESWKEALSKFLGGRVPRLKPFDCSLCMSWWSGIVYTLCTGTFSLGSLAYIAMLSLLTIPMVQAWQLVEDVINRIINFIHDKL